MLGIAATTVVIPGNVSVSSGNTVLGGNVNISRSYARKSGQSALVIYEANGNDGTSSSGSLVFSGGGEHESTILFKSNEVSTDFGYLKYMSTYLGDGVKYRTYCSGIEATANNGINTDSICLMCAGLGQPINSNPTGVSGSGFVGINTMFPSYTLDVAGNIRATGNLRVEGITTHTVSAKMHFGDIGF
jgi:hypothetical protein